MPCDVNIPGLSVPCDSLQVYAVCTARAESTHLVVLDNATVTLRRDQGLTVRRLLSSLVDTVSWCIVSMLSIEREEIIPTFPR